MKITKDQIEQILTAVAKTSDEEVSCQSCEDRLAQFAEIQLAGKEIPDALKAIEQHLNDCAECIEEFEYVRRALQGEIVS